MTAAAPRSRPEQHSPNATRSGASSAARWVPLLPVLYALFSALVGTQSVLFSKTLAVLLRATAAGDNQLKRWFTWVVIPLFLGAAVFWVTRLNKGLKSFPALVIVPTMQIAWTLFSIVSGMLYFREYADLDALGASMFGLGVAVRCVRRGACVVCCALCALRAAARACVLRHVVCDCVLARW